MKTKLIILPIAILLIGCNTSTRTRINADKSVTVENNDGSCNITIIEIDGVKLAVAVGYHKCAITQIHH